MMNLQEQCLNINKVSSTTLAENTVRFRVEYTLTYGVRA